MSYDKPVIGILLSKDDGDIINDVMTEYNKHFDAIYCIDASSDNSIDVIRSFDKVKYVKSEKELGIYGPDLKDGIRQILLEKVKADYGPEGWIFAIHTDEMFFGNPRNILETADNQKAKIINCVVAHFIMHKDDEFTKNEPHITQRKLHYFLGQCESAGYKNQEGIHYKFGEHMKVVPHGFDPYTVCSQVLLRMHFNQRTDDQLQKRIRNRLDTGWQPAYKALENNFYISDPRQIAGSGEVYSPITKFDGEFKFDEQYSHWKSRIIT